MKKLFKVLGLLAIFAVALTACKKQQPAPVNLVEDGFYVVGKSIAVDSMKLEGQMDPGYIEKQCCQATLRDSMYQKYMYITVDGGGFIVKQQSGAKTIVWGMNGDWQQIRHDTVMEANIKVGGSNFTVPKDGFYLFVLDLPTMKAYLLRVEKWSVIGDATAGGWSHDENQEMSVVNISKTEGTWEIKNIGLEKGSIKFRFNHWWTYYDANSNAENNGEPKFFTNLGAPDQNGYLTPGGPNISVSQSGMYDITLKYEFGKGFTYQLQRTGDYVVDYSQDSLKVRGSGVGQITQTDTVWTDWGTGLNMTYSGVEGTVYKFVINNLVLTNGAVFKFYDLQKDKWWGYGDVTVKGDVDSIEGVDDGFGGLNFKSDANKIYNVEFDVDGLSGDVTVTFTAVGDYVPPTVDVPSNHTYSLIGDALYVNNDTTQSLTNWDTDFDLQPQGTDANGNYVFELDGIYFAKGHDFKIRVDHGWTTSYGYTDVTVGGDAASYILDDQANNNNFMVDTSASTPNNVKLNVTFIISPDFSNVEVDFNNSSK